MTVLPGGPDPTSRMHERLQEALGSGYQVKNGKVLLSPKSERELLLALRLLREHGGRLGLPGRAGPPIAISRRALAQVGPPEPRSATLVQAGARLDEIDRAAATERLAVGSISPRAMSLELGDFLEGPYGGLRAVPGGRLEPLSLQLTAVMPDGLLTSSRAAPRHAAGPGLDAFFLGAGARMGLLLRATVRLVMRPTCARSATFSCPSASGMVAAVRRALLDGAFVDRLRVERQDRRVMLEAHLSGSEPQVERDLASLGQQVLGQGGRVSESRLLRPEAPAGDPPPEREVRWEAVVAALEAGQGAALYRLSVDGAIAEGAVEGRDLSAEVPWSQPVLEAIAAAVDPSGTLGGPP